MSQIPTASEILYDRIKDNSEQCQLVEQAYLNACIGQVIYDARKRAGLTQRDLAQRIGVRQSVIGRLEDADYEGQALFMLARIAKALELELAIELRAAHTGPGRATQAPVRKPRKTAG